MRASLQLLIRFGEGCGNMKVKRDAVVCGAILVLMASLPFMAFGQQNKSEPTNKKVGLSELTYGAVSGTDEQKSSPETESGRSQHPSEKAPSEVKDSEKTASDGTFKILDTSSGEVITLADEEFLIGAVAAEMPPSYEAEALKAQCVATYTCYSKKRADERESPHAELKGADFSADLSQKMIYITPERLKEDCGDSYEEIYNRIKGIVDSVKGEVLTYKGEPITCTYYAISSGTTDSSEDVFGQKLPYLVPVSSPYDILAPDYQSKKTVTADEFKNAVAEILKDADFSESADKWIGKTEKTASGTVKTITVGGQELSGSELRTALGLRSACFDTAYKDGKFTFTVRGYGHNVGMSQYGANEMAKQGAKYTEILHHYYAAYLDS